MKAAIPIPRGLHAAARRPLGGLVRLAAASFALLLLAAEAWGQGVAPVNPEYIRWQKLKRLGKDGDEQTAGVLNANDKTASEVVLPKRRALSSNGGSESLPNPEDILIPEDDRVLGYIPSAVDKSYLKRLNAANSRVSRYSMGLGASLPAVFDLRNSQSVSVVKDQGSYGTCWAHATFASLDSWLLMSNAGNRDFSEKHLARMHGWNIGFSEGGNGDIASAYLTRWGGPIAETEDPYPDNSYYEKWESDFLQWEEDLENGFPNGPYEPSDLDEIIPPSPVGTPIGHVQQIRWIPTMSGSDDPDIVKKELIPIKQALMTYGALYVNYFHVSSFYKDYDDVYDVEFINGAWYYRGRSWMDTYCFRGNREDYVKNGGGHAVAIVGWDDNFAASNFRVQPPGDGAFIVKNSWGSDFGINGFFYVSYYDHYFAKEELMSFSNLESTENYSSVFQYDPQGHVRDYSPDSSGNETAWGANMFLANKAEQLAAVGFYALAPNTSYRIEIYTDCNNGNPVSGTCATTQEGIVEYAGFTTVPLSSQVSVSGGKRFSVVLKLTTPGHSKPLALEGRYYYENKDASANANESFVSTSGKSGSWRDLTEMPMDYGRGTYNFCCKAYTAGQSSKTLSNLSVGGLPSMNPGETISFVATATYSDNSTADVTESASWSVVEGSEWVENRGKGKFFAKDAWEQHRVTIRADYSEIGVDVSETAGFFISAGPPPVVADLTATQGTDDSCVRLIWSPSSGATKYSIWRGRTESSSNACCIRSDYEDTSFFDVDAEPGKNYWYFVKAGNAAGYGKEYSQGAWGWRKIAPPSAESVMASDGSSTEYVLVSWNASAGAGVYQVYRADGLDHEKHPISDWIEECEFRDSTAEPGETYFYYVVAAIDATGYRASDFSIFDDGFRAVPVVPASLAIQGDDSISSGGTASFAAYAVYSDGTQSEAPVSPAWEVSMGSVDRTGAVTAPVVWANTELTLSASTTLDGVRVAGSRKITVTAAAPVAPSGVVATVPSSSRGITVSWNAVPGASGYTVSRTAMDGATVGAIATFQTAASPYADTTATPGVLYSYRVAAENAAGAGPWSAAVTATIPLAAPTGVKATSDRTDGVRVTWGAVPGATHYRVARATAATGAKTELGTWTADTAYLDTPPAADTAYWYFVAAAMSASGANAGPWSEGVEGRMKPVRTLLSLSVSGPDRVAAGGEAVYSCRASWSDGAEEAVSPAWSVSPASAGSIDGNGRLAAASVSSDVGATVTAAYGGKTGTASVTVAAPAAATAEITSVSAAQRWPFSALVDIDYTLATTPAGTRAAVSVSAFDEDHGAAVAATTLSGDGADGPVAAGTHRLTWNLGTDHPGLHASSLRVNVSAVPASLAAPTVTVSTERHVKQIVLSWNAVDGATSYTILRGTSDSPSSATTLVTKTGTSYTDSSIEWNTTYYYWVVARNGSAEATSARVSGIVQVDLMPLRSLLTGIEARTPDGVLSDKELNRAMQNSTIADMDGDTTTISDAEMSILLRIQALNQDKNLISAVIAGTYMSYSGMTETILAELISLSDAVKALTKY